MYLTFEELRWEWMQNELPRVTEEKKQPLATRTHLWADLFSWLSWHILGDRLIPEKLL